MERKHQNIMPRLVSACLMLPVLLCCGLFTACGDTPDTPAEDAADTGDRTEASIYDSYEDTRPDYDGMFDYDSGYVPSFVPEGVPVSVEIRLPDGLVLSENYEGGNWETGMTLSVETLPSAGDIVGYDEYATSGDKHLTGWYIYDDAGVAVRITEGDSYGLTNASPLVVYPLFSDNFYDLDVNDQSKDGQDTLNDMGVGKGVSYPVNTSGGSAAHFETVFNTNDCIEEQMLGYSDGLYPGNWFRINTNYRVGGEKVRFEAGKTYTASYALTNYCAENVIATLYHASNGWPYNSSSAYRSRDFDKDILVMHPGETAYSTLTVTYSEDVEYNFLTSVIYGAWYNDPSVTGLESAACEDRKTGLTNDGLGIIDDFSLGIRCHIEETEYINVAYSLPDGIEFADGSGFGTEPAEMPRNTTLLLPTGDDLVYGGAYSGMYLSGWFVSDGNGHATGTQVFPFTRLTEDTVLVPVFGNSCTVTIAPIDGVTFSENTLIAAVGGTVRLPEVFTGTDAEIYGYYVSGDDERVIVGRPGDLLEVTCDVTLCVSIEDVSLRVTVTVPGEYSDIVWNLVPAGYVHVGESGSLYKALCGPGVSVELSPYKDFGDALTWEVLSDGVWITVTGTYTVPIGTGEVYVRPVYADILAEVRTDGSPDGFTLVSGGEFSAVCGDTWDAYLSDGEAGKYMLYELEEGYTLVGWECDGERIDMSSRIYVRDSAYVITPVLTRDHSVTVATVYGDDGEAVFSVEGYGTVSCTGGMPLRLPDMYGETIYNATGKAFVGWVIKYSDGTYSLAITYPGTQGGSVTYTGVYAPGEEIEMPDADIEILPLLADDTSYIPWEVDYYRDADGTDRNTRLHELAYGAYYSETTYETDFFIKDTGQGKMEAGDYIRYKTAFAVSDGMSYDFSYILTNLGEEDIVIKIYLMSGGADLTQNVAAVSGEITISPGKTAAVSFTGITSLGNNGNTLTVIQAVNPAAGLYIGVNGKICVTPEETPETCDSVTLTVILPDGLSLDTSYDTGGYRTGDTLTVPGASQIVGEPGGGRTLLGWYVSRVSADGTLTNEVIEDGYVITSPEITIKPYWSSPYGAEKAVYGNSNDGKELVFGNEQSSLKPNVAYISAGLREANFTAIPSKYDNVCVVGAAGGYAARGTYFSYNGLMGAGESFRCATNVNTDAVVTTGTEHAFIYTFQNFGTGDIYLSMRLVNSGSLTEGETYLIYLAPGESVQYTIVMTFNEGSANKNIMAYFTVDGDTRDMVIGVSVSLVLGNVSGFVSSVSTDSTLMCPTGMCGAVYFRREKRN